MLRQETAITHCAWREKLFPTSRLNLAKSSQVEECRLPDTSISAQNRDAAAVLERGAIFHWETKSSTAQTIDYGNVIYKTVNREATDIQLTL